MKYLFLIPLLFAMPLYASEYYDDEGNHVEVPEDKQVVFIPKDLPQQCHVVCEAEVVYPGVETQETPEGDCCPIGDLCVSPSVQCKD